MILNFKIRILTISVMLLVLTVFAKNNKVEGTWLNSKYGLTKFTSDGKMIMCDMFNSKASH